MTHGAFGSNLISLYVCVCVWFLFIYIYIYETCGLHFVLTFHLQVPCYVKCLIVKKCLCVYNYISASAHMWRTRPHCDDFQDIKRKSLVIVILWLFKGVKLFSYLLSNFPDTDHEQNVAFRKSARSNIWINAIDRSGCNILFFQRPAEPPELPGSRVDLWPGRTRQRWCFTAGIDEASHVGCCE